MIKIRVIIFPSKIIKMIEESLESIKTKKSNKNKKKVETKMIE